MSPRKQRLHPPRSHTPRTLYLAKVALGELNCPSGSSDDGFFESRAAAVAGYMREEEDGSVSLLHPLDGSVGERFGRPLFPVEHVRLLLEYGVPGVRWTVNDV